VSEQKLYRVLRAAFVLIIVGLLIASALLFANGERVRHWYVRGWNALYQHDYATAIENFEPYLSERPFDSDAWGNLASAYFHSGQYERCIEALKRYSSTIFWSPPEDEERYRQELIAYVRAVASGKEPEGPRPHFFKHDAPENETE
jgi:tetratricopeptide (TPR) repeat protein